MDKSSYSKKNATKRKQRATRKEKPDEFLENYLQRKGKRKKVIY
jgi:hypothetical protein